MSCEYVQQYYGVPAEIGRLISYRGEPGIIAEDRGHYIGVNFDSESPGVISNIHPTDDNLEYFGIGTVRKMTRSQQRYRDFLRADTGLSFPEWMGILI